MTALVAYDSAYGNTEQIARAVGSALGEQEIVEVVRVGDLRPEQLAGVALLVVGSPTQKFRPTTATSGLLKAIGPDALRGVQVAAFDTRMTEEAVDKVRILAFFVRIFGYAAPVIAKRLQSKGGELAVPPIGFYVSDTQGPLVDGELERAAGWGREILTAAR